MKQETDRTIRVKIEKIVPNGFGMAFAEGSTVFVALAAKGDELNAEITQRKGKTAFAHIDEIVAPSPDRTEPRCPYFGVCGGCNFQQLKYEAQLAAKVEIIKDCLSRIGKINYAGEIPIVGSPQSYEYRSRAQWHVDVRAKKIGYFKAKSHDVLDVEVCPILVPEMQTLLNELRETIDWASFSGRIIEIEAATSGEKASIYSSEIIEPTDEISFSAHGNRYFYDANTFFQGNQLLIEPLIDAATAGASGTNALDLYCGAGLFTLPLAKNFTKVLGVEGYKKALDFAAKAIETAQIENVGLFAESVGAWLVENAGKLGAVDFVLLDPPRSGTEKETIDGLLKLKPREISYVSCDPAILARDLRLLTEKLYRIESITAIDLFPQTHHVETVVRLKLV